MSSKNLKILIGAGVGASIGYFIGAVIAEMIALKEWEAEHGHDFEYEDLDEDPGNDDETNLDKKIYERTTTMPGANTTTKNYSAVFQNRPDIAELAAKYGGGESIAHVTSPVTDEMIEDAQLQTYDHHEKTEDEAAADESVERFFNKEFDDEEDVDTPEIRIISMAEFANAESMPAVTLHYYDDEVVTDEHGNPIDRPEELVGDEALVSFGELSEDPDIVYVMNLPKKAVYEVVRTNKMYAAHMARRNRKTEVRKRLMEEDRDGQDDSTG